ISHYPVMQTRRVLTEFAALPTDLEDGSQGERSAIAQFAEKYGWLGLASVAYDPTIPVGQPDAIQAEDLGVWRDEIMAMRDLWTGLERIKLWRSGGSEIARRYFADRLESGDVRHNFFYSVVDPPVG